MLHHSLVAIHQQELRAEADRERLVRSARSGRTDRRTIADRLTSFARRAVSLGHRSPRPATTSHAG
ncbi:MAG: hypothetical protein H0V73_00560 [Chloroflexi bacterium]|nr:hypothetical protein [Chloroflexota bacterium]